MAKRKERWRQVPSYPDYDISELGRMRTWKSGKPRLMKTRIGKDGYPRVTLQDKKGNKKVERVHALIAWAFLGLPKGRLVRHKDGKEWRPLLSNLEYGTYLDNKEDKHRHGTDQVGERNSQAELIRRHAKQIYKLKGKYTQQEIANMFGVSRQAVSDIQRGITWANVTGASKWPRKKPKR